LAELLGHPFMPPRWALGYHQCRWGYKSERDIREVIQGFREHHLPISAIHLDIDYMDGFRVFTNHPVRFPNLKRLTNDLDDMGIKVLP
jgi:alpha-glucosidase